MDFGVGGFDGFVGLDTGFELDPETKQKLCGSRVFKQEISGEDDDDWGSLKLVKTDEFSVFKRNSLLRSNNTSVVSDSQPQQQMLSFPSPHTLPNFHQTPSGFSRNRGYNAGRLNGGNIYGALTGDRGPFTPSQWMELELQTLIYKHITANVPIPSNLLIPIRKAIESARVANLSSLLRPVGWGSFHLRFSNTTDTEPGRCRRTDGKKWRCSKDAVVDQKYCERHMNRSRHRSRKPVEGRTGHSVSGITSNTSNKLMPVASSSASIVSGGYVSNSVGIAHHLKNLEPGTPNQVSAATPINRRMKDEAGLSIPTPIIDMKSKENTFLIPKQHNPFPESSRVEFGLVSTNFLLHPSQKRSTLVNDREAESQHSLRQFIDDWPKNNPDRSAISWTKCDTQSDNTQLSISIPTPISSSDFMSSTSSSNIEKLNLTPLKLAREFNQIPGSEQANWIPLSWETSAGGPLGEALQTTNNNVGDSKNSSALNLMTEGWDKSPSLGGSPQLES